MWKTVRAFFGGAPTTAPTMARTTLPATSAIARPAGSPQPVSESATARARRQLADAVESLTTQLAPEATDPVALLHDLSNGPPDSLAQIPAAAQALLQALQDPDLSRNRLGALIEGDPVVAQSILRTANSAVFNAGQDTVASLPFAIDRLGLNITRAVIMQQAISGMISRPGGRLDRMANMVWDHMGRVGAIARTLAPAFGTDADEAFSAGLLHDSGKLVVFDAASRIRVERRRALQLSTEHVDALLRDLHAPLGALLVDAWGLPAHVVDAIAAHHHPSDAGTSRALAETLYVAERVDLARANEAPIALDDWWAEGGLSAHSGGVAERLDELLQLA